MQIVATCLSAAFLVLTSFFCLISFGCAGYTVWPDGVG